MHPENAMAYYELTLAIPERFRAAVIDTLTEAGCLGMIEQDDAVIAYFPETADIKEIESNLSIIGSLLEKTGSPTPLSVRRNTIPDQDWNETWKKGFHAIEVGARFTILPPWEEEKKGRINIVIDPAMAFGTGHHETTRSCLALMETYAAGGGKDRFLDVGTGTGILAIAAAKLGFARITAIDNDPLATEATRENIVINRAPDIEIREGSLDELDGSFDFIVANIISGVLVALAPSLAAHLNPSGIAILSGILRGQENEVIDAVKHAGLNLVEQYPDGKWMSLVVRK